MSGGPRLPRDEDLHSYRGSTSWTTDSSIRTTRRVLPCASALRARLLLRAHWTVGSRVLLDLMTVGFLAGPYCTSYRLPRCILVSLLTLAPLVTPFAPKRCPGEAGEAT